MSTIELTDAEWREFQSIPDQGYSHRHWVDSKIKARLEAAKSEPSIAVVAEAIRRHCTPPSGLIHPTVQIDALIRFVADWIENPPEWVALAAQPVTGTVEDLTLDLKDALKSASDEASERLRFSDAYDRVRGERDAARAVIEQVRAWRKEPLKDYASGLDRDWGAVARILATSPPDALDAVKAAAWDEGALAEANRCHPLTNPYRKENPNE